MIRIIHFDDEPHWKPIILDVFEDYDCELKSTDNTKEFYDLVESFNPEVALLDVMVNGSPVGIDLLKYMGVKHPNTKCIMLSSDDNSILKAYAAKCYAYIHKATSCLN